MFVYSPPACFYRLFLESAFDPDAPFDGIPQYEAHPTAVPPQPFPLAFLESDSSEADTSASSFFYALGSDDDAPGGSRSTRLMESGFFSSAFV